MLRAVLARGAKVTGYQAAGALVSTRCVLERGAQLVPTVPGREGGWGCVVRCGVLWRRGEAKALDGRVDGCAPPLS
jgi:hypothetical protein